MDETQITANQIKRLLRRIRPGTLRFWGEWFGKPYDNLHKLVQCECSGNILILHFDFKEVLSVYSPRGLSFTTHGSLFKSYSFQIADADRVHWRWYYYGRPMVEANLLFEDFIKTAEGISVSTDADWYTPEFHPDPALPAVEIY